MMKRGKKPKRLRKWIAFDGFECKGAEEYLQEMAEKGWLLDEVRGGIYYFVPIEPRKQRYAVKVFDGASYDDMEPSENSLSYAEYCEKAGWHFVGSLGKLHFFYEKQPGAVNIETDARLEFRSVVKYELLRFGYSYLGLLFVLGINLIGLCTRPFSQIITQYSTFLIIAMEVLVGVMLIWKIGNSLIWYFINKRRVKNGEEIVFRGRTSIKINNGIFLTIMIIFLILIIAVGVFGRSVFAIFIFAGIIFVMGLVFVITAFIYKPKASKIPLKTIIALIIVGIFVLLSVFLLCWFSFLSYFNNYKKTYVEKVAEENTSSIVDQDKVPLTAQDLGIIGKGVLRNQKTDEHTVFATNLNYYSDFEFFNEEDTESVGINYEVFTSPYTWIMGKYDNEKLYHSYLDFPEKWTEVDADIWNASTVYCRHDEIDEYHSVPDVRYLVIYPNAVLDFSADKKDLSHKDIKLICDKLHNEISAIPASGDK